MPDLRSKWRRSWPYPAFVLTLLLVVGFRLGVDRYTREPPNFTQIEEGLWLGGYVHEPPPGTQTVLNLCETEDTCHAESHKWAAIPDAAPAPSLDWLREQVGFIETERAAGRVVYVHCHAGVSRSALVTAAFLMRRERWSRDRALEFLRSRRPIVRPNPAFMALLLEWERTLKS